ncbi:MAG TPA: dihydroneopterin aldolase [Burkholderiaceae bacterium]|nr:dihydroneopterin aldolase [Burkholderiaceae bacterium]
MNLTRPFEQDAEDLRCISIRRLRTHASVGMLPHESQRKQLLVLDIDVFVDRLATTPMQDRIDEVLDYRAIRQAVLSRIDASHTNLLETMCDRLAADILALHAVRAVRIHIDKPNAFDDAEAVGIETFQRKDAAATRTTEEPSP